MDILKRIEKLRHWLGSNHAEAIVIPSTDPHCGEYVPDHWKIREWISGFTGSAGTVVVTTKDAALWTDSRYFIQATEQLRNSGFLLMKENLPETPTIGEWLSSVLPTGSKVAICGEMFAHQEREKLAKELKKGISIKSFVDPFNDLWDNRPDLPLDKIYKQPVKYAGIGFIEKLNAIRELLKKEQVDNILLCALDEIAWVTNLRGSDVHCNPVFVSYLLIGLDSTTLYVNSQKLSEKLLNDLENKNIICKNYKDVFKDLSKLDSLWLDPSSTNQAVYEALKVSPVEKKSPIAFLKSIKNKQEIEGFHQSMLRDGIALVKFMKWLRPAVEKGNETELSISKKLEEFRKEQENYLGISFDTIAAYGFHGAIVHYEPTNETNIAVKPEGFLLLDSGAQYLDGTTDITRTIPLGALTPEMKLNYTLVLKGFIQLGLAKFPEGTCGTQLDILARQFIWKEGKNYLHGTGHGVGSHLCVHEGPHQIRMNNVPAALKAGMTVTDEPGLYLEGRYGIRIENTLLVIPYIETEFGSYLQFEHLTLCPIDKEPILIEMLSRDEIEWLNSYHQTVYEKLSPYLCKEEIEWLKEATKKI